MQLCIVAHDSHFSQPANSQRDYPSKITHDKMSAIRNVHILCSNCPSSATTQDRSLFHHYPMACQQSAYPAYPIHPQCILVACGSCVHP